MIDDNINHEYIIRYLRKLAGKSPNPLKDMEQYAQKNDVPIIQPEVSQFLRTLIAARKPTHILEIGTAIGYSAAVMARELNSGGTVTTLEINSEMAKIAQKNISRLGLSGTISVVVGDAVDTLKLFDPSEKKFDLIFIDASKGHYVDFFEHAIRLSSPGGLIVCDNVLYKGMIATDDLAIRRKITIIKRLRKFLDDLMCDTRVTASVVPIGDGVALAVLK